MTCYEFECSHWWAIHSKKSFTLFALQSECCIFNYWEHSNILFTLNCTTHSSVLLLLFITSHVIYNLSYTYKFQLKTTIKFVQISSMIENKGHIGCHYVQWTYKSTHMKKASSWQISGYFRTQCGSLLVSINKIFGIIDIMLYAFGQEDIIVEE